MAYPIHPEVAPIESVLTDKLQEKVYALFRNDFTKVGINLYPFFRTEEQRKSRKITPSKIPNIFSISVKGNPGQRFIFERAPLFGFDLEFDFLNPPPRNLLLHEENTIPLGDDQYLWERSSLCVQLGQNNSQKYAGLGYIAAQIDGNNLPLGAAVMNLSTKLLSQDQDGKFKYIVPDSLISRSSKYEYEHRSPYRGWFIVRHEDSGGLALWQHPNYSKVLTLFELRDSSGIQFPQ